MKNVLFLVLLIFLLPLFVSAQMEFITVNDSPIINDPNGLIYNMSVVEKKPDFPGGIQEFYNFIGKEYKAPEEPGLDGKVYLSFIVEADGSLNEIKVISDIGFGTGDESIRVIKTSPNWIPGEQNGQKVRVLYNMAIRVQTPQSNSLNDTYSEILYDEKSIDVMPSYPGGLNAFYRYITKNIDKANKFNFKGKVFVSFIVETDGSISTSKVQSSSGCGFEGKIFEAFNESKKWNSGQKDGKKVRVGYIVPINIQ